MTNVTSTAPRRPASRGRTIARVVVLTGAMLLATACAGSPTGPGTPPARALTTGADSAGLAPAGSPLAARNGYMLSGGRY